MAKKKIIRKKIINEYSVPERGSLGLLALGYEGLMMWRNRQMGKGKPTTDIIGPIIGGKLIRTTTLKKDDDK